MSKLKNEGKGPRLSQKGQAALPAVLLICGIITEIAIAGTLIAFILSSSGWGERLSSQALTAAKAGVEDAFLRITINKDFSDADGYTFSVGGRTVQVIVNKDPIGYPTGTDQIISLGTALSRQRKLEAIIVVDSATGQVSLKSTEEIQ
ncbi:MAG: hypothetical protein WC475_00280 [Candidatus Paceibacterota bacterium]